MKRKIIKLGQATYVMSLPSKWIRENHLVKGDYLECDVDKERVILSTKKIVNKDPDLSLDLRNYNRRTTTIALHQAYRKGFDIIRVRFGSQEQLKTIRKVTKDTLLGFEVVKEEKDNCVLQNIAEPSAEKYQIIVRKMMLLIKEDIGQMATEFEQNERVIDRHKEIKETFDNFNNFIRRVIIKDQIEGKNSYFLFYFVSQLSLIQHAYFYLYKSYTKEKTKMSPKLIALFSETNEAYELLYNAFFRKKIELAHETRVKSDRVNNQILELIRSHKGFDNTFLLLLSNISRLIGVAMTVLLGLDFEDPENKLN